MSEILFADRGYTVLGNIKLKNLPKAIKVGSHSLVKKNELHITLVGAKALEYFPDDVDAAEEIKQAVTDFAKEHDLTQFELLDDYRLVKRGDRVTLAVMVILNNMDRLYEYLNERFDLELPIQPGHITLYSLDPEVGISINSYEQLEAETQKVDVPELADIKQV